MNKFCEKNIGSSFVVNLLKYLVGYVSAKDKTLENVKSFLIFKFNCASCISCCVGETSLHFCTRIDEQRSDKKSSIDRFLRDNTVSVSTQPAITCSKLPIET